MWIRILTSVVALGVLIPLMLWAPEWCLLLAFGAVCAVAAYEIASCTGLKNEWYLTVCSMLFSFSTVASGALPVGGNAARNISFALLTVVYILFSVVRHDRLEAEKVGLQGFFTLYVTMAFSALAQMAPLGEHRLYLWVTLCTPWVSDTMAYFTGRAFGKRKLCPNISPKKTIAGLIGGILGAGIAGSVLYGCFYGAKVPSLCTVAAVAMLLAGVSVFGDLFASVVKRRFGIKDYGKLFPGHGGVLDRFDSILPVAIVMWALLSVPAVAELL